PVVTPSQDMVLGNYYLTMELPDAIGEGKVFKDTEEAIIAYQNGHVHLHTRVALYAGSLNNPTFTEEQNKKLLLTTRSEEHTSELQSRFDLVCRLLLEKKKKEKI